MPHQCCPVSMVAAIYAHRIPSHLKRTVPDICNEPDGIAGAAEQLTVRPTMATKWCDERLWAATELSRQSARCRIVHSTESVAVWHSLDCNPVSIFILIVLVTS